MPQTTKRSARRAGFTMVELLVVVTIIAILISLTAAAVIRMIPAQQSLNTKSSLTRFDGELQRAYRSAADKFRTEAIPTSGAMNLAYYGSPPYNANGFGAGVSAMQIANGDRNLARVIWTKLRLKQTFPTNFAEANNPAPLPPLSYFKTKLDALGYYSVPNYFVTHTTPYQWESSVCLLWALQRGEGGTAIKESDFGAGSLKDFGQTVYNANNPSSGPTPSGQAVKGLIDDWGTPLAFCRWPVNSTQLNPTGAQPGDKNDPDDPTGLLESTTWQNVNGGTNFAQFKALCHPLVPHTAGTEAQTFRIYPLIVSAGPDKKLGLDINGPLFPPGWPGPGFCGTWPAGNTDVNDNLYPALASPK